MERGVSNSIVNGTAWKHTLSDEETAIFKAIAGHEKAILEIKSKLKGDIQ
ncbi:hypothetical protein [Ectobacillus panaciterrae]|nr:hypothetical protein [Ectobacillus panaciterrae]